MKRTKHYTISGDLCQRVVQGESRWSYLHKLMKRDGFDVTKTIDISSQALGVRVSQEETDLLWQTPKQGIPIDSFGGIGSAK